MNERKQPRAREFAGRPARLGDLLGSETRRFTRERSRAGAPGAVIGIRYLRPGFARWFFAHSFATPSWNAVDIYIDGSMTWRFTAGRADRPCFVELSPGLHHMSVVEAHAPPDRNVLTKGSFEVQPTSIVELSLHPGRLALSPHLRRNTVTARAPGVGVGRTIGNR